MPLIVKWPGVVAPGTTSRALVSLVDVFDRVIDILPWQHILVFRPGTGRTEKRE